MTIVNLFATAVNRCNLIDQKVSEKPTALVTISILNIRTDRSEKTVQTQIRELLMGKYSGPGCSKLMTSLVNVSLKCSMLITEICKYFSLKKCNKLLHCIIFSYFFQQKI